MLTGTYAKRRRSWAGSRTRAAHEAEACRAERAELLRHQHQRRLGGASMRPQDQDGQAAAAAGGILAGGSAALSSEDHGCYAGCEAGCEAGCMARCETAGSDCSDSDDSAYGSGYGLGYGSGYGSGYAYDEPGCYSGYGSSDYARGESGCYPSGSCSAYGDFDGYSEAISNECGSEDRIVLSPHAYALEDGHPAA